MPSPARGSPFHSLGIMAFILAKQRDEDAVSAFRKYSEYLRDNEKRFR